MRSLERRVRFKRDYKREKKRDPGLDALLVETLTLLVTDAELPQRLRDHPLGGVWSGYRDCHLRPDLVLIYRKTEAALSLVRLGSHSELFG
jgi:mRNA interferase YafQ